MNRLVIIALQTALGVTAACGSNPQDGGPATPICKGPPAADCFFPVDDLSFVTAAGVITDGNSTGRASNSAAGKVCMSGTLADAGPTYANWGALLALPADKRNPERTRILAPFDAAGLGITQVQFTIESPPITGVMASITQVAQLECPDAPADCLTAAAFDLQLVTKAGTITAQLSAAKQPNWGDPSLVLNPAMLHGLQFSATSAQGASLDYDFCIRDLKFLDAEGKEVGPAR
jgi:hypothetical protein